MSSHLAEKNKNLFNVLRNCVISRQNYYEEGLINYILSNIDKNMLKENNEIQDINYLKVHSSFWGLVCSQYYRSDLIITDIDYYAQDYSDPKLAELHEKAVKEQSTCLELKNKWKTLLISNNIPVEDNPVYYLSNSAQKLKHALPYNDWLALSKPREWIRCSAYEPKKWEISESSEKLFVKEILNDTYNNHFYSLKDIEYNKLIELVIKQQEFLKMEYKQLVNTSSNPVSEEDLEMQWLEKLLHSSSMKKLIEEGHSEQMAQLFNDSSCRAIINKAKRQQNIEYHPEMLSNLLGIASPDTWINASSTGKNFNLLSFFNAKFKRAYATSLSSEMKMKYKYQSVQKYVLEELEYLKPALSKVKISQEDKLTFWCKVLEIQNAELIKMVARCIALPDQCDVIDENKTIYQKTKSFYNKFENGMMKDSDLNKNYLFKDLYKEGKYEELQSKIPNKTEEVKRKIKI